MKFLRKFNEHTSYEAEVNVGGQDFEIPNVSYCKDVDDVHFNPYNLIEFYVDEITGTTPQTVKIYTDATNHLDVEVSKGNKWYSYLLPKDKGLSKIEGDSVKKLVVKADINKIRSTTIIPSSTVEASFKGSNTSNVTNMESMFSGCTHLTSLDVSSLETSNVTDMGSMFDSCINLTSLDLSNFNTSNVTNMKYMFYLCSGLTFLDVSNFDTSNVTSMNLIFDGCGGLATLDVSNFNTSKVIGMNYMFYGCSGLTSLDLSNFKTSKVTTMSQTFRNCSKLTSLNLSGWDMSNVTNMRSMFYGCSKLNTIRMKGCSEATINKIKTQLTTDGITGAQITTE